MRISSLAVAAALSLALPAAAADSDSGPISPARLSADVKVLAAAKLAGRAPGGPGEAGTIAYLVGQFKAMGLKPAGDKGGWTQAVPLIRFRVAPDAKFSLTAGGTTRALGETREIMAWTQRPVARVAIAKAPLVFVGYGVTAPERGWDDFKGVDLKGKIAVFLINDPDFEAAPGEPVAGKFGGKAATYYGRWTYKYEEAARRGALGALIVHETAPAAYPWSTVVASNGESFDVVQPDPAKVHPLLQGWIQRDVAIGLFKASGLDFEALKRSARTAAFRPVLLKGASFSADMGVATHRLLSHNVLAQIPGAARPNESVMFGAHWDAFGIGPADASGDTVRHGAIDDGMGVAGVLEIARAFAKGPRPQRTVVFGIWTAEERGLLGSEYYASHPRFPLATTAADFTMDVVQTAGASHDLVLVGAGQDSLEADLAKAAARQGRRVTPDPHPEKALFYRADHFSVAKRGVPTLLIMGMAGGPDLAAGGRAAGERWVNDYTTRCYHQVCDDWSPNWDLRGAAQDIDLFYEVGRDLANSTRWPDWNPGSEFKAIRARTAAARK
ncbi:MAG: M28 family metallopeptidase [Caulobacterales bacterium]|jgi:Zn-dependent M28 family amino/carboxypeptidase